MTRPYSNDLRERVVGAVERGELLIGPWRKLIPL
jgi:hypothetical protein